MDSTEEAKKKLKKGIVAILYLCFPVFVAVLIWGAYLNPTTYWQKLVSVVGIVITWIIVFYIEIEVS